MKTLKKLAQTQDQYELMVFGLYMRWCESITTTPRQYQQVLANSAINHWFLTELAKCEQEFHALTDRFINSNVSAKDFQQCWDVCSYHMFNIRPMALLEPFKVKITATQGIPVFSSLNQN